MLNQAQFQPSALGQIACDGASERDIPASMGRLAIAANVMDKVVADLTERLTPVLSQDVGGLIGGSESAHPKPVRAPLSMQAESIIDQLDAAVNRLQTLLGRLEI